MLGVVYVPVSDVCYAGFSSASSNISLTGTLSTGTDRYTDSYAVKISSNTSVDIKARCAQAMVSAGLPIEVLASRHHRADAVDRLCAKIEAQWGQT